MIVANQALIHNTTSIHLRIYVGNDLSFPGLRVVTLISNGTLAKSTFVTAACVGLEMDMHVPPNTLINFTLDDGFSNNYGFQLNESSFECETGGGAFGSNLNITSPTVNGTPGDISLYSYDTCAPFGTYYSTYCLGGITYNVYTDGECGTYDVEEPFGC